MANGSLHDLVQATAILHCAEADAVTLGRAALTHPDWPQRVAQGKSLKSFDPGMLSPIADLANAQNLR